MLLTSFPLHAFANYPQTSPRNRSHFPGKRFLNDKVCCWGSWGTQDIETKVINGCNDDPLLVNYAAKINVQLYPENKLELFILFYLRAAWPTSRASILKKPWFFM